MSASGFLKQSTAVTVLIGPFLDDADAKTPETALSIAASDVKIRKPGGSLAGKNESSAPSHDADGWYAAAFNTTDTNTLGPLKVSCQKSGALPVWHTFTVLAAEAYEALCGSGKLPVDVVQISGDATAADNLEQACDGTGYNLGGGSIVAASVTQQTVHSGTAQAGGTSTITLAAGASATDDIFNYQRIDILSGTGAGQSAVITDYNGSTKVATVDHPWQVQPDNTSVYRVAYSRVPRDVSKVTGDVEGKVLGTTSGGGTMSGPGVWAYDHTGTAISGGGGSAPTVVEIRNELDANSTKLANLDATISSRLAGGSYSAPPSASSIRTEMDSNSTKLANLDATISSRLAAGSYTAPDNSGIADAKAAAEAAEGVTIKLDTMLVPDGSDWKYTPESHADVPTGLSTEDAEKLEEIRAVVLDPMPELTEDPGATPTLQEAQMRQYMEARNKREITSTTDTIHNDAGTAISSQTLNDDGTKLVRGKAT